MNHSPSLLPSEGRAPAFELDALIGAAEQRVVERDLRMRGDVRALRRRVRSASERLRSDAVRRAGVAVAMAAGGVMIGSWLWRRRRQPSGVHAQAPRGGESHHGPTPALWAHLLPLAWPMLPAGVRSRMSPRTAAMVLGVALPLVARLHAPPRPTTTVQSALRVDLPRYAGHWFEIARTPYAPGRPGDGDTSASYLLDGEGLHIESRSRRADGAVRTAHGAAFPVEGGNGAKLRQSFAPAWLRWLPWAWHDSWILRVDRDYQSALVGTPDRKHLRLLSRSPSLGVAEMQAHIDHARQQGYDTSRLRHTPQS